MDSKSPRLISNHFLESEAAHRRGLSITMISTDSKSFVNVEKHRDIIQAMRDE